MAARLEGQSTGDDVIISSAIYNDPAVRDFLNDPANGLSASRFEMPLKGFDEERFSLWRVTGPHPFERPLRARTRGMYVNPCTTDDSPTE